jgi:hypothetical protein
MPRKPAKRSRVQRPNLLPWIFIIILIGIIVFYVPLFPSLTVNFRIDANPKSGDVPIVSIVAWNYQKLSVVASANIPKGQVVLVGYQNTTNAAQYLVGVKVDYGSLTLSPASPTLILFRVNGSGLYQVRMVYWPISEQPNIPYTVHIFAATLQNSTYVGTSVSFFPS